MKIRRYFQAAAIIGLLGILSGCKGTNTEEVIHSSKTAAADAVVKNENNAGQSAETPGRASLRKRIDLGNGIFMDFVLIPAGEFNMGSPQMEKGRNPSEGPAHQVKISQYYYMSMYEVTQDQYRAVMGKNPSYFGQGNYPVENVSWEEAVEFCQQTSSKFSYSLRLPTEAEWEYACRGRTQTRFSFGDNAGDLSVYGWYEINSYKKTHPVGQKKANPFGLYDMHGNVWEWCSDWFDSQYYENSPMLDPAGPSTGQGSVLRGGGWLNGENICRSATRIGLTQTNKSSYIGFRVVMNAN
jgi:formylglycine-generating enzyme required for sulfatase activity